ncbi:hypothetical protein ACNDRY_000714 [Escherichia coli]
MSTITRERLKELVAGQSGFNLRIATPEESMELARIALASLEAEAVAWVIEGGNHDTPRHISTKKEYAEAYPDRVVTPLYTAPPAPVSEPNSRAITKHFDTIALEAAREIMCDVNRRHEFLGGEVQLLSRIQCRIDDACRAAMLQGVESDFREIVNSSTKHFRENAETSTKCWCRTCRPVTISDMRFVVCPDCGNKRCPHANDHRNACTGSNEPGQEGSAYPAAPQRESE